jgi:hypothetical protein
MPTTSLGLRYPDLAAAPDVPADIGNLAADVNTYLSARPPSTHVYRAAAMSLVGTGVLVPIVWTESARDTGGMFTDNSSRVTAPRAGLYPIIARAGFGIYVAPVKVLNVRKNSAGSPTGGTSLYLAQDDSGGNASSPPLLAVVEEPFNIGDYYEVFVSQDSGTTFASGLNAGQNVTFTQARWAST